MQRAVEYSDADGGGVSCCGGEGSALERSSFVKSTSWI